MFWEVPVYVERGVPRPPPPPLFVCRPFGLPIHGLWWHCNEEQFIGKAGKPAKSVKWRGGERSPRTLYVCIFLAPMSGSPPGGSGKVKPVSGSSPISSKYACFSMDSNSGKHTSSASKNKTPVMGRHETRWPLMAIKGPAAMKPNGHQWPLNGN